MVEFRSRKSEMFWTKQLRKMDFIQTIWMYRPASSLAVMFLWARWATPSTNISSSPIFNLDAKTIRPIECTKIRRPQSGKRWSLHLQVGSGKFWVILYITSFLFSRYVAELRNTVAEHKMGHLACFCPGMFALEAGTFYILRLRII